MISTTCHEALSHVLGGRERETTGQDAASPELERWGGGGVLGLFFRVFSVSADDCEGVLGTRYSEFVVCSCHSTEGACQGAIVRKSRRGDE